MLRAIWSRKNDLQNEHAEKQIKKRSNKLDKQEKGAGEKKTNEKKQPILSLTQEE